MASRRQLSSLKCFQPSAAAYLPRHPQSLLLLKFTLLCAGRPLNVSGKVDLKAETLGGVEERGLDSPSSTKGDLTTKIDTVKEDLTTKIDTVKDDLTTKIDTVKEDLTTKIDALETSLKINIATR
ncbi:hypothetical protein NUW58_g3396 [Xylaria curta]|uniref:Uncharacterized protein n=1 Tax=Xylaria curta TaxID=42375 RepID=A0ACC1PBQ2_9PEZI|nr:hypothetical protein NUW58_g3396 [Xylaria curta]